MKTFRYANISDSQVMDFYRPDAAEAVPVIVLVHGDGKFESMYLGIKDIYADEDSCRKTHWMSYIGSLPENFKLNAWIQVGDQNDTMVPYKQAENFANRLISVEGVNVHYEQIPGARHEDLAFYAAENLDKIMSWLENALAEDTDHCDFLSHL